MPEWTTCSLSLTLNISSHLKRVDIQAAQTAETVKRQQGTLLGNSVMNPRVEHCNATELRCEKSSGNKMEQLFAENALSEKKRTKHPAGSKMIASSEHVETPPPRHLMNPISTEQLARFRKMVRRLPKKISFEHA